MLLFFQGVIAGIGLASFYWGWQFLQQAKKIRKTISKIDTNFEQLTWVNRQQKKLLSLRRNRF